jgi:hypothetical protein
LEPDQGIFDVARHGQINRLIVVIPREGYTTVESTCPVYRALVVSLDGVDEMIGIINAFIFDTKMVYH